MLPKSTSKVNGARCAQAQASRRLHRVFLEFVPLASLRIVFVWEIADVAMRRQCVVDAKAWLMPTPPASGFSDLLLEQARPQAITRPISLNIRSPISRSGLYCV
jgi:hypothetical protein